MDNITGSENLKKEIREHAKKVAGPTVNPEIIIFTDATPKTRSGKIMRRVLKAISMQESDLGDITTLSNPEVVKKLILARKEAG